MTIECNFTLPILQLERLDSDLKNYRSNSIKESIRRGFDALGDHYVDCGELKYVNLHVISQIPKDYIINVKVCRI